MGVPDRIALYALVALGALAFQAYRAGQLGDWLRSKFWNSAEAAPAGLGWADALGSAQARLGTPPTAEPSGAAGIVAVAGITGGVHSSIAGRVRQMIVDAAADGVTLTGGGYRDSAAQAAARRRNGCPDLTSPSSTCRVPTAPVGRSQHERGLAIDFELGPGVFDWLKANAARYGLFNLPSEAWHWSTTGR